MAWRRFDSAEPVGFDTFVPVLCGSIMRCDLKRGGAKLYNDLIRGLAERNALIVHCSRTGKGDEGLGGLFYPDDLRKAIDLCAAGEELSCSLVWPEHTETFGSVGIILKPRSMNSLASVCPTDAGTPRGGKGFGKTFSHPRVAETFAQTVVYNEWKVRDADTIGVFVHPTEPIEVSQKVAIVGVPDFMGSTAIVPVQIPLANVAAAFPELPTPFTKM